MKLEEISTARLVEELARREAVEKFTVDPYQEYRIRIGDREAVSDTGPAVILRVWD